MTTDTSISPETDTDEGDFDFSWTPPETLVQAVADRVTEAYDKHARLNEIGQLAMRGEIPEADTLEDWQQQELFEEVRDELAARDNGMRR